MAAIECSRVPSLRVSGKLINHFSSSQQSAADDISLGPGKRSSVLEKKNVGQQAGQLSLCWQEPGSSCHHCDPPPSRIHSARPIEWRGGGAGLGVLVFSFGCGQICGDFSYRCSGCWSLAGVFNT